jgi:CheY-like chemotaxis protein
MEGKTVKILLVEDNPGDARLVMESLKDTDVCRFELTHVEKFSEAVDTLKKEEYQLILLDLTLPDSNGVETFEKMHREFPKIPIVVLTGYEDETVAFDALQEGIEIYLIKGKVDGELLTQALDYAIKKNQVLSDLEQD